MREMKILAKGKQAKPQFALNEAIRQILRPFWIFSREDLNFCDHSAHSQQFMRIKVLFWFKFNYK